MLEPKACAYVLENTEFTPAQIKNVLELLFEQECTVPFIARYRKEVTNNMDEVGIRQIQSLYEEYLEIEKRRAYILETIKKAEQLTPALEKKILAATTLNQLEDIYAPFKSKRKTKAMIAKENGLEPLANWLFEAKTKWEDAKAEIESKYVAGNEKVKDIAEAINGACDILLENFAHDTNAKEKIREVYWSEALIVSSKKKDAETIKEYEKFKDFFEFSEPVRQIKDPKNTHRFLALRRGQTLKVLKVDVVLDKDRALNLLEAELLTNKGAANYDLLKSLLEKAYNTSISTSMDLEVKGELKKIADEAAIDVFGVNLKNLLLQPYLGSKAILGIDPGIRTGCKVVVIDATGKYIGDHVVFPFAPKFDVNGSKVIIEKLLEAFSIEYIAIGDGTNGRETLEFVETHIQAVKDGKVKATMISESGASIYSASEVARKEFPDKDVTVRGAISIARRFQDPLAELVKIDPKSIGVGQYQHDVNQVRLKKSLEAVVESCVNYVGVDLNTASAPLLSYISGIGPSVAENIVKFREKSGGFKNREELLKVPRFSAKIFEQSAGFLRIYGGANPLDGTFIHPERYQVLTKWCEQHKVELAKLVEDPEAIQKLEKDSNFKAEVGDLTFQDIVKSLKSPKQDPRSEFKTVEFSKDVRTISDLKVGSWYTGVVGNITNFGAFINIGIKESGLLHVSQMADKFVSNPLEVVKVGDTIKVRVTEVDLERKRIALSAKSDGGEAPMHSGYTSGGSNRNKAPKQPKGDDFKNNPFAKLGNLKLK